MRIEEMMREAVADTAVDGARIAAAARGRGTTLRRRRRVSAFAGAALAVAAVAVGVTAMLPHGGAPDVASSADTATLDGRSTAAVLASLVGEVAAGELGGYAGQGLPGGAPDTFARLELTPPGEGVGVVEVNVQGRDMLDETPNRCPRTSRDCTETDLANGDLLLVGGGRTMSTADGPGLLRGATLRSESRGMLVSVVASNGFDLGDHWDVTRPDPVLTDAQLTALATDPAWAFDVAATYAEAGRDLAPYDDLDVPAEGDWTRGRLPQDE